MQTYDNKTHQIDLEDKQIRTKLIPIKVKSIYDENSQLIQLYKIEEVLYLQFNQVQQKYIMVHNEILKIYGQFVYKYICDKQMWYVFILDRSIDNSASICSDNDSIFICQQKSIIVCNAQSYKVDREIQTEKLMFQPFSTSIRFKNYLINFGGKNMQYFYNKFNIYDLVNQNEYILTNEKIKPQYNAQFYVINNQLLLFGGVSVRGNVNACFRLRFIIDSFMYYQ